MLARKEQTARQLNQPFFGPSSRLFIFASSTWILASRRAAWRSHSSQHTAFGLPYIPR